MKKLLRSCLYAIGVAYVPCLLLLSFLPNLFDRDGFSTPYLLNLLFFFLFSFPFFCACMELGFAIVRSGERPQKGTQKILYALRAVLAIGIFLTLIDLSKLLLFALMLTLALILFWVLHTLLFGKQQETDGPWKKKSFWLGVAAILLTVCATATVIQIAIDRENRVDPLKPTEPTEAIEDRGFDASDAHL